MSRAWAVFLILIFAAATGTYIVVAKRGHGGSASEPSSRDERRFAAVAASAPSPDIAEHLRHSPYVIINFWASWCAPCMAETPSLLRFVKKHKDQVALVSISQDTTTAEYAGFRKAFPDLEEVSTVLVRDTDRHLGRLYAVENLPETYVYQPSSQRYFRISGALDWEQEDVLPHIEKGFSAPSTPPISN